jgi:hypothetical protein
MALLRTAADSAVVPIDVQALKMGTTRERWLGIYFQDQHVGYTVSRARDGGARAGRSHGGAPELRFLHGG